MKALAIIALLLGIGAIGASVFAKVETHGNYTYMAETLAKDGPRTKYDVPLLEEYASTLKRMHMIAWAAGGLALLLGAVVFSKRRGVLPVLGIVAGVLGAGLSVLSAPPWV